MGAMRVHESVGINYQRMAWRNELAEQFRADVAEATAAPDRPAGPRRQQRVSSFTWLTAGS